MSITAKANKITNLPLFRSLHYRNFRFVILSTFAQAATSYVISIALSWLVLNMTDSSWFLGVIWAVRSAPYFLFGIMSGAIADRIDRRMLLIFSFAVKIVCALIMGMFITWGWIELWHIFTIAFIFGTAMTFDMPTQQSLVVDIVGQDDAMNALSLNNSAMRLMGVVGGITAGVVIELFGINWCFYMMIAAYLVGILALLSVRGVRREVNPEQISIWVSFIDGIKIIGNNQIVRTLVVIAVICQILGFSYLVMVPIFARDILKVGVVGLGTLTTVDSIGGILGALALASLGNYKRKGWLILCIFLSFGVFLLLFSQSNWYPASLLLMGLIGVTATTFDTMEHILLQLNVTEEQRGRAMGIWMMCIGFTPLSALFIGATSNWLGAQLAVAINGLAILISFIALVIFVPKLRHM